MKKSRGGRASLGEKPKCETEECDSVARSHKSPICSACYQSLRYHVLLGPIHVYNWQKRLRKFTARANSVGRKHTPLRSVAGGRR